MLDRSIAPVQFKFTPLDFPQPERFVANNLLMHHFQVNGSNAVKIEFLLKNANSLDENKLGLNLLTSKLFVSGTNKRSAANISGILATLGAFIDVSPSFDYTSLTVYSLKKNTFEVLKLIAEIFNDISFPHDEIELQKKILTSNYQVQQKKNNIKATQRFRKLLFDNHPYGLTPKPEDWESLNQDDVIQHFNNNWRNFELIVIGELDNNFLYEISNLFTLNISEQTKDKYPLLNYICQKEEVIKINGSVQTSIKIGCHTIGKNSKDYPHLLITNYILGGFFGSKLMKNIREDKGLTYGIYSSLVNLHNSTYFVISSDVDASKKEIAIQEIKNELQDLIDKTISEEELNLAKNHWLGSFQNDFSSTLSLNEKFKNYYLYGFDVNYYSSLISNIKRINVEDIKYKASKYLNPSQMNIVQVGG